MSDSGVGQRNRAPAVLGVLLALAGLATMEGWIFHQPAVVRILPGTLMVFSAAFGFAIAGVALVCGAFAPALRERVHTVAGLVLAGIGSLALAQHMFGVSDGIDWPSR